MIVFPDPTTEPTELPRYVRTSIDYTALDNVGVGGKRASVRPRAASIRRSRDPAEMAAMYEQESARYAGGSKFASMKRGASMRSMGAKMGSTTSVTSIMKMPEMPEAPKEPLIKEEDEEEDSD